MKDSLLARWRLMRRRFRRRFAAGLFVSLLVGGLFCVMELLGVVGLIPTGHLHERSLSEVWWHSFVFAAVWATSFGLFAIPMKSCDTGCSPAF
jgi:hypothetical protein